MKLVNLAECAEQIARQWHDGQFDKAGRPYIEHVSRVAAAMTCPESKAVAWLHDILEDTEVTPEDLANWGMPRSVVESVERLTRYDGQPYHSYIRDISDSEDDIAVWVKVADLKDHLDDKCPPSLVARYRAALDELSGAIA